MAQLSGLLGEPFDCDQGRNDGSTESKPSYAASYIHLTSLKFMSKRIPVGRTVDINIFGRRMKGEQDCNLLPLQMGLAEMVGNQLIGNVGALYLERIKIHNHATKKLVIFTIICLETMRRNRQPWLWGHVRRRLCGTGELSPGGRQNLLGKQYNAYVIWAE